MLDWTTIQSYIKSKIQIRSDCQCWEWTGSRFDGCYGRIRGKIARFAGTETAHRVSFLAFNGEIPDDQEVRHSCDNKPCCNPSHLILGTRQQNVQDRFKPLSEKSVPSLELMRDRLATRLKEVDEELKRRFDVSDKDE